MITATSPCRIDIGGTWDMGMFALPLQAINPCTITIALDYKTIVEIDEYDSGKILLVENGVETELNSFALQFIGKNALINAILSYFCADGISVRVSKEFPYQSGLGGSGSLAVCLISALNKCFSFDLSKTKIVNLAHRIENDLRISYTGFQDQCAAMYGGVRMWQWIINNDYWKSSLQLLNPADYFDLEERLIISYIGKGHDGNIVNQKQIDSFLDGSKRNVWLAINRNTRICADAFAKEKWDSIAYCITFEHENRTDIVPERLTGNSKKYEAVAKLFGPGFGVAGSGGTVFYLAKDRFDAMKVKAAWSQIDGCEILDSKISYAGTMVE